MRQLIVELVIALTAVACGSDATVSGPPGSMPERPSPAGPSSPLASPTPSGPTSESTPVPASPVVPRPLTIRWRAADPTGLDGVASIVGVARAGGAWVLIGEFPYESETSADAAAWWSTDGIAWTLAKEFQPGERILALTAGGPGFIAAGFGRKGAGVWTSPDGRAWTAVSDASLASGVIAQLVPTASGVVGFGWRGDNDAPQIWTSPDGLDWLAATNETGLKVARGLEAVASYDGRAIAVVRRGDESPAEIWETTGRAEWTQVGTLATRGSVGQLAGGARGWVAIGSNLAWTSTDGRRWSKGVPGPDVGSDVIVDDAGFIVVGAIGSLPGETCGDQRPFSGRTWTSSDGRVWKLMPVSAEFRKAMVTKLLVVDRTLIGYGQRIEGIDRLPIGRWTATLPAVTRSAGASDKATDFEGCGG